jgi:hypothetical protein
MPGIELTICATWSQRLLGQRDVHKIIKLLERLDPTGFCRLIGLQPGEERGRSTDMWTLVKIVKGDRIRGRGHEGCADVDMKGRHESGQ